MEVIVCFNCAQKKKFIKTTKNFTNQQIYSHNIWPTSFLCKVRQLNKIDDYSHIRYEHSKFINTAKVSFYENQSNIYIKIFNKAC